MYKINWIYGSNTPVYLAWASVMMETSFTTLMEQHAFKNVNNYLNTNIYSYLETSGGQIYILYLNVVHFFNTSVN